ncbi:hypothetical protein [Lacrimispora xylanisolvens]|uniref:hypothetical protein n=1 Tax=Lacrimispora xylanisolvens TaxID=384636 RepID=UPI002402773E
MKDFDFFSPNFQSQYNVLPGNKLVVNRPEISVDKTHSISFSPSAKIIENKKNLQQSYETRLEKAKLRKYNG